MLDVSAIKEEVQEALDTIRRADTVRLIAVEAAYREHLRTTRKALRALRTLQCEYGRFAVKLAICQKLAPLENGKPRWPDAVQALAEGMRLTWAQGSHAPDVVFTVPWTELMCRKLEVDPSSNPGRAL